MTVRRLTQLCAAAVATIAVVVGCVACSGSHRLGGLDGEDTFPSEQLTDWVSYAEQVSIVRVTAQHDLAMPADEAARGEGYQGREVSIVVERTLWTAKGITPVTHFDVIVAGYTVHNHKRTEVAMDDSPRIEPGDRFLMPITQTDDGSYTPLSGHAMVPLSGALRGLQNAGHVDDAVVALRGKTPEQVAAILKATKPNPVAAQYMNLKPESRARKVVDLGAVNATPAH